MSFRDFDLTSNEIHVGFVLKFFTCETWFYGMFYTCNSHLEWGRFDWNKVIICMMKEIHVCINHTIAGYCLCF